MTFGDLVVLSKGEPKVTSGGNKITTWHCRCNCGKEITTSTNHLRQGHTKSCGCLQSVAASKANTTHALRNTSTYRSWNAMLNRCRNKNAPHYKRYGGRGISVCEQWSSFENFLADMGERPKGMSLDRIDNGGNYEPENCRWATDEQQNENRRNTRWIEHDGLRLTASEWARRLGIRLPTLLESLSKHPIDIALRKRATKGEETK